MMARTIVVVLVVGFVLPARGESPPAKPATINEASIEEVIGLTDRLLKGEPLTAAERKRVSDLVGALIAGPKPTDLPLTEEFIRRNDSLPKEDRQILRSRHVDAASADARINAGIVLSSIEGLPDYPAGARLLCWETVTPVGGDMILVSGWVDVTQQGPKQRVTVALDKPDAKKGWRGVFVRRGGVTHYPPVRDFAKRTNRILAKARETEAGREILELH